jgi:hypothetical protein
VDEHDAETLFSMLGMSLRVMSPGEPSTTYHWETEQEDFLVLFGEAVLIVEGQERRLTQDSGVAYARFAPARATSYPPGLLLGDHPASTTSRRRGPWTPSTR